MQKGKLFVISAPSGCGKGTILDVVMKNNPNMFYSVSATTRPMREGEKDGANYFYYSKDEFENALKSGEMLEYTTYCDNYYGTPKNAVDEKLNSGLDVVLEIETDGAMQIKAKCPEAVLIFILPPSLKELERRLVDRKTETLEVIAKRMDKASSEIKMASEYDFIVVNDDIKNAISDFENVIKASKMFAKDNVFKIDEVLK